MRVVSQYKRCKKKVLPTFFWNMEDETNKMNVTHIFLASSIICLMGHAVTDILSSEQ